MFLLRDAFPETSSQTHQTHAPGISCTNQVDNPKLTTVPINREYLVRPLPPWCCLRTSMTPSHFLRYENTPKSLLPAPLHHSEDNPQHRVSAVKPRIQWCSPHITLLCSLLSLIGKPVPSLKSLCVESRGDSHERSFQSHQALQCPAHSSPFHSHRCNSRGNKSASKHKAFPPSPTAW